MEYEKDERLDAKQGIAEEFDRVSRGYDVLNRLNPGYHRDLRSSARRMQLPSRARILDLCCGTGLSTLALRREYPDASIVGLDVSPGMLALARQKRELAGVTFVLGDAMDPEAVGVRGPFDGVLMAYGIRNVPDRDVCLRQIAGLLRPGGVVAFHEYSVADSRAAQAVWNAVSLGVIIPLGYAVTRSSDLFRYLRRSVLEFDGVRDFSRRLERAGFDDVRVERMGGWQRGIVHTFLARRGWGSAG